MSEPKNEFLTVSQVTTLIKNILEKRPDLKNIWIVGEVSGYTKHTSGHIYFTLKDKGSQLPVTFFSMYARSCKFQIKDGSRVKVFGSIGVYFRGGRYNFNAVSVLPYGEGELFLKFQELKKKLEKEGLFEKKRPLPTFPTQIAIITSKTGATLHDMLRVIRKKNRVVDIFIIPAQVQGDEAAAQTIKDAIELANQYSEKIDLIILGRGGGSLEDLWVFNTETVARAIYASRIPIISGIGHEVDFTIADFVADRRESTPTAAAERAVPDIGQLSRKVEDLHFKLQYYLEKRIERYKRVLERFSFLSQRLQLRINEESYAVSSLIDEMINALKNLLIQKRHKLLKLSEYLRKLPEIKLKSIQQKRELVRLKTEILGKGITTYLRRKKLEVEQYRKNLKLLSVEDVLSRGFSIIWDQNNEKIKRKVADFSEGENIVVQVVDGKVKSKVLERRSLADGQEEV